MSMTVTLPPEVETFVAEKVGTGEYPDAAAVVADAPRLLRERDEAAKLERPRAALRVGIERGEGRRLTPAVYEEIVEKARAMIREGASPNADVLP